MINSYLIKFNISKDFNNTFHINKLYLININPLPNQFINDMQPSLIQKDRKKKFIIENIIIKLKNKKERKWKK